MQKEKILWCPFCGGLCDEGWVEADVGDGEKMRVLCACYHEAEKRCKLVMMEYDLFNIARALDVMISK
jgi:formylmethanofuran dehydrogenase subunit B